MPKVPTRQVVRLAETPAMILMMLDFSSCGNTLVGYTDSDGDYVIKSYGEILGWRSGETGETSYAVDCEYESDQTRLKYIRQGFDRLDLRLARQVTA